MVVLTLALGIGSSAAIFGAVKTVLIRPLGVQDPDRLVMLWPRNLSKNIDMDLVTPGLLNDWRNESHAFGEMAHATDAVYTMKWRTPEFDRLAALGQRPACPRCAAISRPRVHGRG